MAEGGWIAPEAAVELSGAYQFLRRIENRLQMIGDEQTHSLPAAPEELPASRGFPASRRRRLRRRASRRTSQGRDSLRRAVRAAAASAGLGAVHRRHRRRRRASDARLRSSGSATPIPRQPSTRVRAWQSGRYAATKSERARERLTEFLPFLLDAFGRTAEPDLALANFDRVIASMPAGVQLFSLLAANPSLTRLIADIMGTAPRLAHTIARRPRLLDAVLDPGFFEAVPAPAKIKALIDESLGRRATIRRRSTGRGSSAASRPFSSAFACCRARSQRGRRDRPTPISPRP